MGWGATPSNTFLPLMSFSLRLPVPASARAKLSPTVPCCWKNAERSWAWLCGWLAGVVLAGWGGWLACGSCSVGTIHWVGAITSVTISARACVGMREGSASTHSGVRKELLLLGAAAGFASVRR